MSLDALRELTARLLASTRALGALGAALDAHAGGAQLEPALRERVDEVLAALGAGDVLAGVAPADVRPLLGEIRAHTLGHTKLLFAASRAPGWTHREPELLEAAGDVSIGVAHQLRRTIAPALDGLAARLDTPGAAFLDVGVGVAALSIEMARLWPSLRVVGVDRFAPALAIARAHVDAADLGPRVELREQAAEALADVEAFDLAWIPGLFVAESALPALLASVHRALRPGGWLLHATVGAPADPLAAALARLTATMFGGAVCAPARIEALLRDAGFVEVRELPGPPGGAMALLAARRPA